MEAANMIKKRQHHQYLTLFINQVDKNDDGTYTVYWGYSNNDIRRIEVKEKDSYLYVRKGSAIICPSSPPNIFAPGTHSNCFKTIVSGDIELMWKVKRAFKELNAEECQRLSKIES